MSLPLSFPLYPTIPQERGFHSILTGLQGRAPGPGDAQDFQGPSKSVSAARPKTSQRHQPQIIRGAHGVSACRGRNNQSHKGG